MDENSTGGIFTAVGMCAGYSAKGTFDVELKLTFMEGDLPDALQFVAGIGRRLKLLAIVSGQKIKLGNWGVYRLSVDKNATTTVVFKTSKEQTIVDNLSNLISEDESITFKAQIAD